MRKSGAARAQAEEAIEKVKGFLSDAESYGAGHTSSYIEAKKDLSQAEALVKSASLFDCWDAILKVNAACEWTIKVPSEYEKVPPKYLSEEIEEKRSKVEKIEGRRKTRAAAAEGTVGHVIHVVVIIIAVVVGVLTGDVRVAGITWIVALVSASVVWKLREWVLSNQLRAAEKELDEALSRREQKKSQTVAYLQSKAQQLERELNLRAN